MNNLDDSERKKLREKFVDAGGEDISYKKRKALQAEEEKDSSPAKNKYGLGGTLDEEEEERRRKRRERQERRKKRKGGETKKDKKPNPILLAIFKIRLFIDGVITGATETDGKVISKKFLAELNKNLLEDINLAKSFLNPMFTPTGPNEDVVKGKQLKYEAAFNKTLTKELLERFTELLDEELWESFIKEFKENSGNQVSIISKEDDIRRIFKPLYMLKHQVSSLKDAVSKGFEAYQEIEDVNKTIVSKRETIVKKVLESIFYHVHDVFLIFVKRLTLRDYDLQNMEDISALEGYLGVSEEDRIGYRTKQEIDSKKAKKINDEAEEKKKKRDAEKKEKEEFIDDYVRQGLIIINELVDYKSDFDEKSESVIFNILDKGDKIYRCQKLLDVFEREYSLAITTNKIQYDLYTTGGGEKINFVSRFNEEYAELNSINHVFTEYINLTNEIRKIEQDSTMRYETRMHQIQKEEAQRSNTARAARKNLKNILSDLLEVMKRLLIESNPKNIVLNADEKLDFDQGLHGKKRIHGLTSLEALWETFYYLSAFNYLISEGELSGAGLSVEEKSEEPPEEGQTAQEEESSAEAEDIDEGAYDNEDDDDDLDEAQSDEEREQEINESISTDNSKDESEDDEGQSVIKDVPTELRIEANEMANNFNYKKYDEAKEQAADIISKADEYPEIKTKAIIVMLNVLLKEENYQEVLSQYTKHQKLTSKNKICKAVYKKAKEYLREGEKDEYTSPVSENGSKMAYDMRSIIMTAVGDEQRLRQKLEGDSKAAKILEKLNSVRSRSGKAETPLLNFANNAILLAIFSRLKTMIIAKAEDNSKDECKEKIADFMNSFKGYDKVLPALSSKSKLGSYSEEELKDLLDKSKDWSEKIRAVKRVLGII